MFIAEDSNRNTISIQKASRHQIYNCVCCGQRVWARNKKPIEFRKRKMCFAHKGHQLCTGSRETYLHEVSKRLIKQSKYIMLPDLGKVEYIDAIIEKRINGIQPDAKIILPNGDVIAIEIFVTNKKTSETILKYKDAKMKVYEINLSDLDYDSEEEVIRHRVIEEPDYKQELHYTPSIVLNDEPSLEINTKCNIAAFDDAVLVNQPTVTFAPSINWQEILIKGLLIFVAIKFVIALLRRIL